MRQSLEKAIRDSKGKSGGYRVKNGRKYDNYFTNEDWRVFLSSMSDRHKSHYLDGDGGELLEKKGRYGIYPPKMASFGSSSHMIYDLSKNFENFIFEKKLPTRVGGTANLDGYLVTHSNRVFYEAKKCEIYEGSHVNEKISTVYKDVYESIKDDTECQSWFNYLSEPIKSDKDEDKDKMKVTFKIKDKEKEEDIKYFDLKQLICHYLAISADILEGNNSVNNIKFIYLIFDPEKIEKFISTKKDQILNRYRNWYNEAQKIDQASLFKAIVKYQAERLGYSIPAYSFEFCIIDQDSYIDKVKKFL